MLPTWCHGAQKQILQEGGHRADPRGVYAREVRKELQSLATKAQEQTWAKETGARVARYLIPVLLLTLLGVFSTASQLSLSPVFGSLPSAVWNGKLTAAGCFIGWAGSIWIERLLPVGPAKLIPVFAIAAPAVHFFLSQYSSVLTARWGPVVIESLTLFPVALLTASCVAGLLEGVSLKPLPGFLGESAPGLGSLAYFKFVENLSSRLVMVYAGRAIFLTRVGLQMLLASVYTVLAPSKLILLTLPAIIHTTFFNYHLPTPMATAALQAKLEADSWLLLDRKESLTGYISVLESVEQGFRVLRCDHSLLGGEWTKVKGPILAEPIYSVFVMLEAVRLVEVPEPIQDRQAKALVVGLGIGTTPAAFVAHGIDTTIVEIDPVVHEFASKYFQLPDKHTAVIDDAVSYTRGLVEAGEQQFDYIVHDVFTGGAEPLPLFTLEFLQGLHDLLKPGGVIAIMVMQTILHVFPSCRVFREAEKPSKDKIEESGQDFINAVIFCRKTADPHEIDLAEFDSTEDVGLLFSNGTRELAQSQEHSAMGHWDVMRIVLPAKIWELW
ncbi:unnamed protein product [Parascedosporium putredinis]|uniref:Spermine/spermidine synthase n=1 Tax=Parascedosporium putredinis TaxID=1442378 RepID=A0A9P1MDW8_9PEZI|nr:unnamed protein product [Parascedosporium putredinis]CAI8004525.1 unnamed protein product [Parascedosporium putredinis]